MAEVKWIKITTDIFDDEKILLIESLPERDSLLVIWFKLLCMAGRQNNSGVFMLNDRIAYTDEMLATIFRRPLNTVRLALTTFESYGMIEIIDNVITIPKWEKHQNIDGMEKIKEQNRARVAKHREKQKLLAGSNITGNVTVTQCNATDKEEDKDKDKEKDKNNNILSDPTSSKSKKSVKHKHGEFQKVLLTDEELQKLTYEYGDILTLEAITFLDEYIEEKGYKSKSHYLAIKRWVIEAVQEKKKKPAANNAAKPKNSTDDFFGQLQQMYNEEC